MGTPDEPRRLEAEMGIRPAVANTLVRLPAAPDAPDAQLQRAPGSSQVEYLVPAVLSPAEGRALRRSDLAEFTDSSLSRPFNVVARLEKPDRIGRAPAPADGRCTPARLTEGGWDKAVASAPGPVNQVRRLVIDPLTTAQQRQPGAICSRVVPTVDPGVCSPRSRARALSGGPVTADPRV